MNDLNSWLRNNIQAFLEKLLIGEELNIVEYNSELQLNDTIAHIDFSDNNYSSIEEKKTLLLSSLSQTNTEEIISKNNFQIVKLYNGDTQLYFGYYKGIKKSTKRKKFLILEGTQFNDINDGIVDLGGMIDFILLNDSIYVINSTNFEYAFKFNTHIIERRNQVLDNIVSLPCFNNDSVIEIFREKANHHFFSRGLAQVSDETLENLERYYNDRCTELSIIGNQIENATEQQLENLTKENGILIDLIDLIDFENENQIIIDEDSNVKPLLHLFQDKIMKSFLTEKIRTILA